MTLAQARRIARVYERESDLVASYHQYKPWWAFWVGENEAARDALWDCDINPDAVHFPFFPPPKKP